MADSLAAGGKEDQPSPPHGISDDAAHHSAGGFHNPAWMTGADRQQEGRQQEGPQQEGRFKLLRLLRWRLGGGRARWPRRVIDPPPAGDPWIPPPAGSVSVTFIGHSTFLIRLGSLTILTDPQFSERASPVAWAGPRRARAPGRPLDALPPVDLVLLSHNHYDHLDLPSLRAVHRHSAPRVVAPLGNEVHVRKAADFDVRALDWWQQAPLGREARVTAVPARHFSSRSLRDAGRGLWAGFMAETQGTRVLFAGDSGDGAHWTRIRERLGAPDVALLPIGAYAPRDLMRRVHMDPSEAVRAHRLLGAGQSIGMHFGTFQLTDEAICAPERAMRAARAEQGVPEGAFVSLGFGECRVIVARPKETSVARKG